MGRSGRRRWPGYGWAWRDLSAEALALEEAECLDALQRCRGKKCEYIGMFAPAFFPMPDFTPCGRRAKTVSFATGAYLCEEHMQDEGADYRAREQQPGAQVVWEQRVKEELGRNPKREPGKFSTDMEVSMVVALKRDKPDLPMPFVHVRRGVGICKHGNSVPDPDCGCGV